MANWDSGRIYYADILSNELRDDSDEVILKKFSDFLENFRLDNHYVYRYTLSISYVLVSK